MIIPTCYMCDAPESSREHVPPQCLFPEERSYGANVRKNLITVPSCDVHNSHKSKDDEFLRATLTMIVGNNQAGRHQFIAKTLKAVRRKPHAYRPFFQDMGPVPSVSGRALKIDRARFDRCIVQQARALLFHLSGEKWFENMGVFSPSFFDGLESSRPVANQLTLGVVETVRPFLQCAPVLGDNPEVFKFRAYYDPASRGFALAAIFYDACEVFVVAPPDKMGEAE